MFHHLQRWFTERRNHLHAQQLRAREASQRQCNEALWSVMNFDQGTKGLDRNVRRAIQAGADVNATVPDGYGRASGHRPLAWTVNAERWDLVVWLLKQGADPNHAGSPSLLEWRQHAPPGQPGHRPAYEGPVPVFAAAVLKIAHLQNDDALPDDLKQNLWKVVDAFLEHGANPALRAAGTTGLAQAVMRMPRLERWSRGPEMIERLRHMGLDVADDDGRTPLHWAVRYGYHTAPESFSMILTLLRAGANPYAVDSLGNSPLHDLVDVVRAGDQNPGALTAIVKEFAHLNWDRPNHQGLSPWDALQHHGFAALANQDAYTEAMDHLRSQRIALESQALRSVVETAHAHHDASDPMDHLDSEAAAPRRSRTRL